MIGNDKVDGTVSQSFPERFAILAFPNRRTTFEFSGAVRNVFGCEMQIVRASFNCQREAEPLRVSQERQRISRRMMHDMNPASGFARELNHQRDRLILSLARPRSQKCLIRRAWFVARRSATSF